MILGSKHISELEKLLPPPSNEHVGKIDEVKNAQFSFKKTLRRRSSPKLQVKERDTERLILKVVIHKG